MPIHVRCDKERQNQANKFEAENVQARNPRHDIQNPPIGQSNTKHPYSKTKKKKGNVKNKKKEEQGRKAGGEKGYIYYNITGY